MTYWPPRVPTSQYYHTGTLEIQHTDLVWRFLKKLKTITYDPAIPFMGIYAEKLKAGPQGNICHSCIIHCSQKVEATQVPISK